MFTITGQPMLRLQRLPRNVAAVLTFSRPPLVFLAFGCALWLMITHHPLAYVMGLTFLLLAMAFDWIDGWFADRYLPDSRLGALVDRMMDRIVLSIIFPVLGAGMFWRLERVEALGDPRLFKLHLLHAIFVLGICVIVLMRDQLAQFLRSFAKAAGQEVESYELTRLRTIVASPVAVLLYAHAFYQPAVGWEGFYRWVDWVDRLPLRVWFVVEILFLVITIVSVTLNLRKYGALALDEICEHDERLRRRILAVIPNTLTLMNGLLGITAVIFASYGRVSEAVFVLLGAAFFDRLDGVVARRLGLTEAPNQRRSRFSSGALLDDISDGISFAVAPALMFYLILGDLPAGLIPHAAVAATAVLYAVAGISRLIYFTLDKHPIPGFFKGMPVPAAALMVSASMEIVHQVATRAPHYAQLWVHVCVAAMIVAAVVMNLFPIRYIHLGRLLSRHPALLWSLVATSVVVVFTPYLGALLLAICGFYLISPLFTGRIDPAHAEIDHRPHRSHPGR
ncbi:MAG: CDP-alcohol phosphatidyltransferase family protein [SAR324 cluster bacterium]|nr:CDP-alcohol phosphatidyltransferase family protein [SAR324 cluster bacterium]